MALFFYNYCENKIHLFGFHFANLDIRQDSRKHNQFFNDMVNASIKNGDAIFPENYYNLTEREQIKILSEIKGRIDLSIIKDEDTLKALETMKAIKTIQDENGEKAANRYIISNNQTTLNVMQLFAMLKDLTKKIAKKQNWNLVQKITI